MAQYLDSRGPLRTRREVPPQMPWALNDSLQSRRQQELQRAMAEAGLEIDFDVSIQEFRIRDRASGANAIDGGRLYLTYLGSGKPKIKSILRVWKKAIAGH